MAGLVERFGESRLDLFDGPAEKKARISPQPGDPCWWANPLHQHPKLVKPLWQMHQRNSARCLCAHSFCNACCTAFCASIVSQQLDMLVIWVATYLSSENVSPVLLSSACFWKHLHQSTQAWFGSIKKLCRVDFLFGLTIRLTKHYRSNGHFFSRLQPKHRPKLLILGLTSKSSKRSNLNAYHQFAIATAICRYVRTVPLAGNRVKFASTRRVCHPVFVESLMRH